MWQLVVVEDNSPLNLSINYISAIVGFIGMIITLILLIISVYYFIKVFLTKNMDRNNNTETTEDRLSYELLLILEICTFFPCLSNALLKSNIITGISVDQFSLFQCTFGFLMNLLFYFISRTLFSSILIHRIQIAFKDSSTYRINHKIYYLYYTLVIITYLYAVGSRLVVAAQSDLTLLHNTRHDVVFCTPAIDMNLPFFSIAKISAAIIAFMELIIGAGLLFLFSKRLYLIRNSLIEQYLKSNPLNTDIPSNSSPTNDKDIEFQQTDYETQGSETNINIRRKRFAARDIIKLYRDKMNVMNMTDGDVLNQYNQYKYLEIIIRSHQIIKKQTILAFVAIISSLLFWILVIYNPYFVRIVSLDLTLNLIMLVLMFNIFKKYWICCEKYGFCVCCNNQRI